MKSVRLNRLEIWIADHAAPIFLVVAVLIVAGAGMTFYMWQKQGDTAEQVNVIVPRVTKVSRAICDQQSLAHSQRAARCAERIRVGLINCRKVDRCRAALLAVITYPPPARGTTPGGRDTPEPSRSPAPSTGDTGGGDAQSPPKAGQQPSPGSPGDNNGGQGKGQDPASAPAPAPSGPPAPAGGPPAESPRKGPPAAPGGGSSSGAAVEVCVPRVTCVGADFPDLDPKGLIP
jgi:hypothetical protein